MFEILAVVDDHTEHELQKFVLEAITSSKQDKTAKRNTIKKGEVEGNVKITLNSTTTRK